MTSAAPLLLPPNQPPERPYRGGAGIRELRGAGAGGARVPEDFVASTTTTFGSDSVGLTVLPDGRSLRDAIRDDPAAWLGEEHVARFGADPALLVKILSTGERLFTHFHPDGAFARDRFGLPRGKTEAWLITSTGDSPTGSVWIGFRRELSRDELADRFEGQDAAALLDALVPVTVAAGDWVHVPAGTPHAIGPGITLVELQEPSDLSILLEYRGFPGLDREKALLGLTFDEAVAGLATSPLAPADVERLHGRASDPAAGAGRLLPAEADEFFRADRLAVDGETALEAAYSVIVVTDGEGSLAWPEGSLGLARGSVVLVPYGAGPVTLSGSFAALRARPPA